MPLLEPRHDLAHPVEADGAWSESYYFNAYDPPTDSGFFTRVGIRPNEGTMDVGMSVWLPDGALAEYRSVRPQHEMVDTVLEVGDVRYDMLEPMASWRLRMDGVAQTRAVAGATTEEGRPVRIALDVTFEALMPAVGTDGQGARRRSSDATSQAAASVGKGHLEQAGRYTGGLAVDGRRLVWGAARGNRDRSWGPRSWGGPRMWRWFSINVGDDLHFGGIRLGTDAGDLHRGWVFDGGRAASVRQWDVRTELAEDGITQRRTHLGVHDKEGRRYDLTGTLLRVAPIGRRGPGGGAGTLVNEGLARWEVGGRTGYGIAEYLHQLDEHGRPAVAVA